MGAFRSPDCILLICRSLRMNAHEEEEEKRNRMCHAERRRYRSNAINRDNKKFLKKT